MNDTHDQFRQAMAAFGLAASGPIIDDGVVHRCGTNSKPRGTSGWYILHSDGIAAGSFGDWREGFTQTWCSKSDNAMTEAERQDHRARVQAMQAQREADLIQRQHEAAIEAARRWPAAKKCTNHPYLTRKGVQTHGARIEGSNLLIPIRIDGIITSLQTIAPDGTKMFMPGGQIKGGYFGIGKPAGQITVCEGFATGASIHEATDSAVAVAFNAGNLGAVAGALRYKFPDLKIIIAADDDQQTAGNPGLTKARAAALAIGGYLAIPDFGANRPDGLTDFNDLHQLSGLEAVKRCIENATLLEAHDVIDAGATGINYQWPELQPLIDKLEAQEYPLDALPDLVRYAVEEVAGFVKAPIPLIATSALGALSLAIQAHTDVARAEKLSGPCSLFLIAIADSGERKSSCDGYFTKAIRDYEARQQDAAKPLTKAYKSERDAWEAQRSGIKEAIKIAAKKGGV